MKLSQTFIKTLREAPKEETATNGALLVRAGYIHKEMAGIYDFLPLGLRVIDNIKNVIRKELNSFGCEEICMSILQNPDPWQKTGRWSDQEVDIWFKTELSSGGELGLAPTHEEPIANMLTNYVKSYKDLPFCVYQIKDKFRNEPRAKSGILRGREFIMKDAYSFHTSEESLDEFYERMAIAYENIYKELGLGEDTFKTFASGGIFSKYSHEFQTLAEVGEDTVYYNKDKTLFFNEEVFNDDVLAEFGEKKENFTAARACEVGNIFKLMRKYSAPVELKYSDESNKEQSVYMGCYGIGVSRLMGVIVEKYADDKGLVWPENIAPYKYYFVGIGEKGEKMAEELYLGNNEQIILDDRNVRPGEKFADAELMGIPYRVVLSDKTLADDMIEITERKTGESKLVRLEDFKKELSSR